MAYERELTIGAEIARAGGELALKIGEGNLDVESKSDESPVTIADKACEKLIVEALGAAFPGDGLLGEEGAHKPSRSGRRWIIDPIDGTRDFVRGCQNPVLILPDDVPPHPLAPAMECAMLAPKAEVSIFPWKEPKERIPLAVRQIHSFLKAHRTA